MGPATLLEVQGSLKPGPRTVSQVLLRIGIPNRGREAMSQKHGSAILETISKVPAFVLFHQEVALLSRDSQLGATSLLTNTSAPLWA